MDRSRLVYARLSIERAKLGAYALLQCYFDDSGTHDASEFVVWGGVLGGVEQFADLDAMWLKLLSEPLPGKPPIKNFHLAACIAGGDDFKSYSPAERDHVRNLFREAILKSRLMPVAFGLDVLAWDQHFQGDLRDLLGDAERASYGLCLKAAFKVAADHKEKMEVFMDKGRQSEGLRWIEGGAHDLIPEGAKLSTIAFPSVKDTPGLQAADTIANEFYRYGKAYLSDNDIDPAPHFSHFVDRVEQLHCEVMNADQIKALSQKMRDIVM